MTPTATKPNRHVFVSYSRSDRLRVAEIIDALRRAELDVWLDQEGIKGATFWRKEIVEAIAQCGVVLFFASRHSCASDNVSKELALASEEGKPILPVFLDAVELSPELRFQVAGVHRIAWHEDRDLALRQTIAVLESYSLPSGSKCRELAPPILRSRRPRLWRWPIVAAVCTVLACVAVTFILRGQQIPSATSMPAIEKDAAVRQPPALRPAGQASYRLQDAYYVESVTRNSDYRPYLGIRMRYKVLVTQSGQTLDVRGEKIGEVVDGEERVLSGRGKTAIHLSGHLETPANGSPHLILNGDEGSTSRSDFSTMFELQPTAGDLLTGTFKSTAANASGTAVWIPEKQWLKTAWRTR